MKNEPYRAVSEIPGFSFQMADRIALAEGLSPRSEERILGGLFYVLSQYASEGHCCVPADALYFQTAQTLGLAQELVESAGQEAEEIGEIPSVIWRDRLFCTCRRCMKRRRSPRSVCGRYPAPDISEARRCLSENLKKKTALRWRKSRNRLSGRLWNRGCSSLQAGLVRERRPLSRRSLRQQSSTI